jgi:hypothetical protein
VSDRHAMADRQPWRSSEEVHVKRSTNTHISTPYDPNVSLAHHARTLALHHGEKILIEIPRTLRRFGQFMLVLSITIPAFLVGLLFVLWHLAK